ncbi:hypothetical protein QTP88_000367 [Uroleucon formosanum]
MSARRKSSSGTVVPGFLRKILKDRRLKLSARCNAAGSSFNFGPKYLNSFHKNVTNVSPRIYTKKCISKIDKNQHSRVVRRLNFDKSRQFKKKQKFIAGPDEDYRAVDIGIGIIDMPPEEFDVEKIAFLKKN